MNNQMPAEPLCQGGSPSDSSSSQPTEYPETTDSSSTLEKTLTGEDEAVQHGRKHREQFKETLAGYKSKKLKKTIPASSQSAHFAEKSCN